MSYFSCCCCSVSSCQHSPLGLLHNYSSDQPEAALCKRFSLIFKAGLMFQANGLSESKNVLTLAQNFLASPFPSQLPGILKLYPQLLQCAYSPGLAQCFFSFLFLIMSTSKQSRRSCVTLKWHAKPLSHYYWATVSGFIYIQLLAFSRDCFSVFFWRGENELSHHGLWKPISRGFFNIKIMWLKKHLLKSHHPFPLSLYPPDWSLVDTDYLAEASWLLSFLTWTYRGRGSHSPPLLSVF